MSQLRAEKAWTAMGTRFQVTVCTHDTSGVAEAFGDAMALVARVERVLSDYDPLSEVSRLATASMSAHASGQGSSPASSESAARASSESAARASSESAARASSQSAVQASSESAVRAFPESAARASIESAVQASSESAVRGSSASAARASIQTSPTLWAAWSLADSLRTETEGAFDVTVGSLTRLWRYAFRRGELPSAQSLDQARASSGREHFRAEGRQLYVTTPDARLDFGGIGKGIAADSIVRSMTAAGFGSVLVDAGGDLVAGEGPDGTDGWRVALPDSTVWVVSGGAIASSGDAYKFVEVAGRRYSHILDPATGLGMQDSYRVTVVAEYGAMADALATALSVRPDLTEKLIGEQRMAIFGGDRPRGPSHSSKGFQAGMASADAGPARLIQDFDTAPPQTFASFGTSTCNGSNP